jgi:uncharacterized membrane protein (UPF0127 family)
MIVINATTGKLLSHSVTEARFPWQRIVGLLSRARIAADEGLFFKDCALVHTIGMRSSIDIVFLDRNHQVRKLYPFVEPGRTSVRCADAVHTLEMGPGFIAMHDVSVGDRIALERVPTRVSPSRIQISIGDQTALVDVVATRRLYAALTPPASRSCPCPECRSMSVHRNTILPLSFRELLGRMGVDGTNETNLWAVAGTDHFFVSAQFDFAGESVVTPPRTNAAVRSLKYAFSNVASTRGVETARALGLGRIASVRYDGRVDIDALLPDIPAIDGMPHLRHSAERRS